jgi:flagellar motor switch protein FliN/FliY
MADEKELVNQDEIEKLLQQQSSKPASPDAGQQGAAPPESQSSADGSLSQADIEALLSGGGPTAAGGSPKPQASESAGTSGPESTAQGPAAAQGLGQEGIDRSLGQGGAAASVGSEGQNRAERPPAGEGNMGQADVEYLLAQAERALESIDSDPAASTPPGTKPFQFEEFVGEPASAESASLDLISDVQLDVKIELGRTDLYLEDVLKLRKGSVVPLDKLAGDPVDIYVNDRLIARGEVLVLNDNFCVRVGELIAGSNAGS